MSFSLNTFYARTGTRFRLFAQSPVLSDFKEPEVIYVSSPVGSLGPGPSDQRMYALQPEDKKPYGDKDMPPYAGRCRSALMPGIDGHFDHIAVDDPAFTCAHMFGGVRRVLDIWETYLGGPIPWHFAITHPQLEMIPHVPWNNAHFGWGFMEFGEGKDDQGELRPYALNFDVLAHEVGHGLVFSLVGMPDPETLTTAYRGFHESTSDCIALVSGLHFDTFVSHLLRKTKGDLYTQNELNRIGELSKTRQIRNASNALKLSDVVSMDTPPKDLTGKQVHKLGQPLTGAIFDILVEFFMAQLVDAGLVRKEDMDDMRRVEHASEPSDGIHAGCAEAYARNPDGFHSALCAARDMLGLRLAQSWHQLTPAKFTYETFARMFLDVDRKMTGIRHQNAIRNCFEWREIATGSE